MNVKKKQTITWETAPDTLTVAEYAEVSRFGKGKAKENFEKSDFPRLEAGNKQLVDKNAARLYNMGISTKTCKKESLDYLILLELQKLNKNLEVKEDVMCN